MPQKQILPLRQQTQTHTHAHKNKKYFQVTILMSDKTFSWNGGCKCVHTQVLWVKDHPACNEKCFFISLNLCSIHTSQGCGMCVSVYTCVSSIQQIKQTRIKSESVVNKLKKEYFHLRGEQVSQSQRAHSSRGTKTPIHRWRDALRTSCILPLLLYHSWGRAALLSRDWQVMSPQLAGSFTSYTMQRKQTERKLAG